MKKRHSGGINIGTSLILVIFVVLALVSFAALSYLSAKSAYTLSKETADRIASYYDANRMAEPYLENIEIQMSRFVQNVDNEESFYNGIEKLFNGNDRIEVLNTEGKVTLNYAVAITNGQNLEVSIVAKYPEAEGDSPFYIDRWATSINQEWLEEAESGGLEESGVKLLF